MKITPNANAVNGSHRTGTLQGMTAEKISKILGFSPNVNDDEEKVVHCWAGYVNGDKNRPIAIWDYKGSHLYGQYSTYGDRKALRELFDLGLY